MTRWTRFASPATFLPLAARMAPWFAALAAVFGLAGLAIALFIAPTDAQQGDAYRIIFIHVPAAWMSMFIYLVMAAHAAVHLVLRTRLSALLIAALAPTGALFTALALWTGALWGKPTWGTWWVWDARLTSEALLLLEYLGYFLLKAAVPDEQRGARAASLLVLVGAINVPIIYFSVRWWNTLHQGASVSLTRAPAMAHTMLSGMLLMALAAWMYSIFVALVRVQCLADRRHQADVEAAHEHASIATLEA